MVAETAQGRGRSGVRRAARGRRRAKPFHPDELAARIRAVLRRSTGASPLLDVEGRATSDESVTGAGSAAPDDAVHAPPA